jgi:hypothetical protein
VAIGTARTCGVTMPWTPPTEEEAAKFVAENGCYCGGEGTYTSYNCGEAIELTCPHCLGTGKKSCKCTNAGLDCPR